MARSLDWHVYLAQQGAALALAQTRACEAAELSAEARDSWVAADKAASAARARREAAEDDSKAAEWERRARQSFDEEAELEAARTEAARGLAQAREDADRAELAALEAEDAARLTSRERDARRVARMLLAAGVTGASTASKDKDAVSLKEVGAALSVQSTVAGQRRQSAYDLILAGYTG